MKPKVICHMMSSVDGRLIADRWTPPFDGTKQDDMYEPYYEMSEELGPRAWMIGNNTMLVDGHLTLFNAENNQPTKAFKSFVGARDHANTCIIFDSRGKIAYTDSHIDGDNVIVVLGEMVSEEYLFHLRDNGISYLFAGKDGYDLHTALEKLNMEFGYDELLLDGGGLLNGRFLKAGLVDELSLLMYPGIDGLAGMPSIFEYKGTDNEFPAKGQAMELLSLKQLRKGIVWMHYKFHKIDF